jgi:HNH endonuclease
MKYGVSLVRQRRRTMRSWIFQGNPDDFDLDAYLATAPIQFPWLVTRYGNEVTAGDRIYIWRTQGEQKGIAGIVAEAEVIVAPALLPESADAIPFWRANTSAAIEARPRAILRLVRIATPREIIRREWCAEDPVLRTLPNLKMAAATNYPLAPEQADRLATLWSRTGHDWTRDESVAGLWAYARTSGGPVSRLPGSAVADVALRIGRAISGVYNKVMNFRHLDPRDEREGMSGAGEADAGVWDEFFDKVSSALRLDELEGEFNRLWGDDRAAAGVDPELQNEALTEAARALEQQTLSTLMSRYNKEVNSRPTRPRASTATGRVFERSALVVAIARRRADYQCEVPGCQHPVFVCVDGTTYSEIHHIVPLSNGGEDLLSNVACLCPAHHREVHVGKNARDVTEALKVVRLNDGPGRSGLRA